MKNITLIFKKLIIIMLILAVSLQLISNQSLAATVEKEVIVKNQKELELALSNKDITSITIQTSKKANLTVPKKSYTTKRVYVKAPNATIVNNGTFKSVNVYVASQAQLDKALANTTIKYTYITINTTSSKEFELTGKYTKVGLVVNAPNATIINNADFKTVNVYVTTQKELEAVLRDPKVTTVTISTKKEVELTIPEGEYSSIKLVVAAPKATVVSNNATFKSTSVSAGSTLVEFDAIGHTTPTPEPVIDPSGDGNNGGYVPTDPTPITPTPIDTNAELIRLKASYVNTIREEILKLKNYVTANEYKILSNSTFNEWVSSLESCTTIKELENKYPSVFEEVKQKQSANDRFVKDNPYFTTVINQEEIGTHYTKLNTDGTYYEFTTHKEDFGIEKYYYVSTTSPVSVNTFVIEEPETTITTGSAITYNVKAWNNLNGADDVVEVWNLVMDTVDEYGFNPSLYKLDKGTDYRVEGNSIIITGSDYIDLPVGRYGFCIKTQVPYLNKNTDNYVFYNIIEK